MNPATPAIHAPTIAHLVLCAALFWSVFCRSVASSEKVAPGIRFAFWCLGSVSLFGIAAPWAWAFTPSGFSLSLLAAIVLVQLTTARHWAKGVPPEFLNRPAP